MRWWGTAPLLAALLAGCSLPPSPQSAAVPPVGGGGTVAPRGPMRLDHEPQLDIGLAWDRDTVVIEPRADVPVETESGDRRAPLALHGAIEIATLQGGARVRDGAGTEQILSRSDTLWIGDPTDTRARLSWTGRTWRGAMKVFLNSRNRLTLAVRVPLETYLLGVVPGEIGALSNQLAEAGRAQAVAARSYTLYYLGRRGVEGFDLYGTVEDQVYGATETERPLATQVVQSTRGLVALSDGWPIRANYCSTCGGISAEVWEAWPEPARAYLVSQRDAAGQGDWCSASPVFRWQERWTAEEFLDNVGHYGPSFGVALPASGTGELVDVRAAARTRSGRVWRLDVTTTTGRIQVPAYVLRQVLRRAGHPESILRSNLFKIDVRRDAGSGRALEVVASGAGSGHGVGLCQTGALGMARAGERAEQIVAHYYPGAELRRLY